MSQHAFFSSEPEPSAVSRAAISIAGGLLVFIGLFLIWHPLFLGNFLLFHAIAELFAIVVATSIFMLAWNARRMLDNDYLLFLGIGYLYVAGLDLLHTLAYPGMGVLVRGGSNAAPQLWLAARIVEVFTLLGAFYFLRHRLRTGWAFAGFTVVFALFLLSILHWQVFPAAFVDGTGLTPFKQYTEYGLVLLLAVGLVLFYRNRNAFAGPVVGYIAGAFILTMATEIAFTLYTHPQGLANVVGHYFKIVSFWLIYKALIETGLRQPYELLYRDLKQSETALEREREDLRDRVEARTKDLSQAVTQLEERTTELRKLASQLTRAEEEERRRLARVLHDHLQQILFSARLQLSAHERQFGDERFRKAIRGVDQLLGEAIQETRTLSVELSPPVLSDSGLSGALDWLAINVEEKQGLKVQTAIDPEAEPENEDLRIALFAAVRELLLNVVKHSGTMTATLQTAREDKMLRITILDNGVGYDPASARENFGLLSIRERLGLLGAEIEVKSAPGAGVRVELLGPLRG